MNLEEKLYRENLELAPFSSRFFAFLIDEFLISFVFSLIYWDSFAQSGGDYERVVSLVSQVIWQFIILSVVYESVFLTLYGATLGKLVLKIRVIGISLLDSPSFLHSLTRTIFKAISENLFYVPFLFAFFSPFKQTLHDYVAKTIVIKNA